MLAKPHFTAGVNESTAWLEWLFANQGIGSFGFLVKNVKNVMKIISEIT